MDQIFLTGAPAALCEMRRGDWRETDRGTEAGVVIPVVRIVPIDVRKTAVVGVATDQTQSSFRMHATV